MAEAWNLPIDPRNVFPNWFIANTDPSLDAANHVSEGKPWIKTTNDTVPYGPVLGLFYWDNGAWEPMLSSGPAGPAGPPGADGADGAPGSVFRSGSGAPASGLGVDSDWYLDTSSGDVYQKAAGSYSVITNMLGPPGPPGPTLPGMPGEDGPEADWLLIPGPPGPPGAAGAGSASGGRPGPPGEDGADGEIWMIGGAPQTAAAVSPGASNICRLALTVDTNIANAANSTAFVNWDSEVADASGMHDNVTNKSRITAVSSGPHIFEAAIQFAGSSGTYLQLQLYKNGVYVKQVLGPSSDTSNQTVLYLWYEDLNTVAGDYYQIAAGGSGSNRTAMHTGDCYFNAWTDNSIGAVGATGAQGVGTMGMQGEEGPPGEDLMIPGPPGAQGASAPPGAVSALAGGQVVLFDQVLGVDTATIDTGATIPSGYDELEIVCIGRTDEAVTSAVPAIQFNGDATAANYARQYQGAANTTNTIGSDATVKGVGTPSPGSTADANVFSIWRLKVLGYDGTSKWKFCESAGGMASPTAAQSQAYQVVTTWKNTAAINRITWDGAAGTAGKKLVAGSRMIVLGRKNTVIVGAGQQGVPGAPGEDGQGDEIWMLPSAGGGAGAQGPAGAAGAAGARGVPGEDGADAELWFQPGPMGAQGPAGSNGSPGAAGSNGMPGPPGEDGAADEMMYDRVTGAIAELNNFVGVPDGQQVTRSGSRYVGVSTLARNLLFMGG